MWALEFFVFIGLGGCLLATIIVGSSSQISSAFVVVIIGGARLVLRLVSFDEVAVDPPLALVRRIVAFGESLGLSGCEE